MKKFFTILIVASAFFSVSASAQKMGGKMGMEKQTLMDSLKLSETAADSVISIRMQLMEQMKTVKSDNSLSDDQKKEKIKPIKQEMRTRLKKYLTDDQMAKLQEMEMVKKQNKNN